MQIWEACKYASDASREACKYASRGSKNEHTHDSDMHQPSDIHKGTWMHENAIMQKKIEREVENSSIVYIRVEKKVSRDEWAILNMK